MHPTVVLVAVVMLFGSKRVPEIGRSLGEGIRGLKESVTSSVGRPAHTEGEAPTVPPSPRDQR